ncbi:MAG: lysozyme, partial [Waterburya sp.]
QLGALTSLVYNTGVGLLYDSTLISKLNTGDYAGAAEEFPRWNKADQGGVLVELLGLTRRRLAEQKLFLTPFQ